MKTTLEKVAQDALTLSPAERAELAEFLVQSLDSSDPGEAQQLWLKEAQMRLEEVRSGKAVVHPGEDVLAEARRLIGK